MNRFDRITAMLLQLHTRRVVKAQDMAEHFGISLRTVYRDMRSLEEAGVPIAGEAGVGYSLMDGYRLPPVLFTKEEALALVMAEKMIETLTDDSTRNPYRSALSKIKAVLKTQEKDLLERIEDSIQVFPSLPALPKPFVLQPVLSAVGDQKVVNIRYTSRDEEEPENRSIEPVGIYQHGMHWYVIAYCRLRQAYRQFRTDRIQKMHVTDEGFSARHPSLSTYLKGISEQQHVHKIVIEINPDIARYIETSRYYYGFMAEQRREKNTEMTFLAPSLEGFARWVLMFATEARIVEPAGLHDRVLALAQEAVEKLSRPETLLT